MSPPIDDRAVGVVIYVIDRDRNRSMGSLSFDGFLSSQVGNGKIDDLGRATLISALCPRFASFVSSAALTAQIDFIKKPVPRPEFLETF